MHSGLEMGVFFEEATSLSLYLDHQNRVRSATACHVPGFRGSEIKP